MKKNHKPGCMLEHEKYVEYRREIYETEQVPINKTNILAEYSHQQLYKNCKVNCTFNIYMLFVSFFHKKKTK